MTDGTVHDLLHSAINAVDTKHAVRGASYSDCAKSGEPYKLMKKAADRVVLTEANERARRATAEEAAAAGVSSIHSTFMEKVETARTPDEESMFRSEIIQMMKIIEKKASIVLKRRGSDDDDTRLFTCIEHMFCATVDISREAHIGFEATVGSNDKIHAASAATTEEFDLYSTLLAVIAKPQFRGLRFVLLLSKNRSAALKGVATFEALLAALNTLMMRANLKPLSADSYYAVFQELGSKMSARQLATLREQGLLLKADCKYGFSARYTIALRAIGASNCFAMYCAAYHHDRLCRENAAVWRSASAGASASASASAPGGGDVSLVTICFDGDAEVTLLQRNCVQWNPVIVRALAAAIAQNVGANVALGDVKNQLAVFDPASSLVIYGIGLRLYGHQGSPDEVTAMATIIPALVSSVELNAHVIAAGLRELSILDAQLSVEAQSKAGMGTFFHDHGEARGSYGNLVRAHAEHLAVSFAVLGDVMAEQRDNAVITGMCVAALREMRRLSPGMNAPRLYQLTITVKQELGISRAVHPPRQHQ